MDLAHRAQDGREQSILEHNNHVATLCAAFAASFGAGELGRLLGLAHDIGKYSDAFQRRIRCAPIQTDHSTAGAQEILPYLGWPGAYCVAGHHGGLPDGGGRTSAADSPTLSGRLKRSVEPYGRFAQELCLERVRPERMPKVLGRGGFTIAFWIRMLYSCLVDADFLDTEEFMRGSPPPRGSSQTMEQLLDRLEKYVEKWAHPESELDRARWGILQACMDAGENQKPGLFTLTVPTGRGKTVSSLAFALRHAVRHRKKRIVYVIPYTSMGVDYISHMGQHHGGPLLDALAGIDGQGLVSAGHDAAHIGGADLVLDLVAPDVGKGDGVQYMDAVDVPPQSRMPIDRFDQPPGGGGRHHVMPNFLGEPKYALVAA